MKTEEKRIPVYGSMSRPNHPDEGIEEVRNGRIEWNKGEIEITYVSDEFTSVCPKTGQPDFNKVIIKYIPDMYYIESKTMKFYLWAFRDYGIHCEKLAVKIAEDIKSSIECHSVTVVIEQKPRGGVGLTAMVTR